MSETEPTPKNGDPVDRYLQKHGIDPTSLPSPTAQVVEALIDIVRAHEKQITDLQARLDHTWWKSPETIKEAKQKITTLLEASWNNAYRPDYTSGAEKASKILQQANYTDKDLSPRNNLIRFFNSYLTMYCFLVENQKLEEAIPPEVTEAWTGIANTPNNQWRSWFLKRLFYLLQWTDEADMTPAPPNNNWNSTSRWFNNYYRTIKEYSFLTEEQKTELETLFKNGTVLAKYIDKKNLSLANRQYAGKLRDSRQRREQ